MLRNHFDRLLNDTVYVVGTGGGRAGPYKATVSGKGTVTIFDETLDVEEGYSVVRVLPNGKDEVYTVLEANFQAGLSSIPSHYNLTVRKNSSLVQNKAPASSTTINITNSQGIQVGDYNSQQISNRFSELIQAIEQSTATPEEKAEAKSALKGVLTNPIVAAVLGGAVSGLLAAL